MAKTALTKDGEQAHLVDDDALGGCTLCGYEAVLLGDVLPAEVARWPVTSAPLCPDCIATFRREQAWDQRLDCDALMRDRRDVIWW
jgi:hypothetical protein